MKTKKQHKEIVLAVPDIHAPFQHPGTLDFLADLMREWKPTRIVNLGDEIDACALSFHDTDPDGMNAGQEHREALKFMRQLYKVMPKVDVCTSNHTARPFRRAFKFGIPTLFLKQYHEFMEAPPGWTWADHHEIDGVRYEHGEGFSGADAHVKAMTKNRQSVVIGHVHSYAGVSYSATAKDMLFGMNAGCLIDNNAYAFAYGKKFPNKPILGAGIVVEGHHALFIPMNRGNKNDK